MCSRGCFQTTDSSRASCDFSNIEMEGENSQKKKRERERKSKRVWKRGGKSVKVRDLKSYKNSDQNSDRDRVLSQ